MFVQISSLLIRLVNNQSNKASRQCCPLKKTTQTTSSVLLEESRGKTSGLSFWRLFVSQKVNATLFVTRFFQKDKKKYEKKEINFLMLIALSQSSADRQHRYYANSGVKMPAISLFEMG
ncbi:hypothetical protein [Xanthocytophaga agilis]|uniref:Uncharacterized protein n=1 Tax=Xanthocytophaga agilis TaxID=3048010 RepID=A0AAE3UDD4_9BACT|nr:hypothetical protein [Xanthocytophaga agilis]MDJ1501718.1 hypothetical protein [Xanthocytophaga agilis]